MGTCGEALVVDPDCVKVLYRRGQLRAQKGALFDYAAASADLKRALAIDPDSRAAELKKAEKQKYGGAFAKFAKQDEKRERKARVATKRKKQHDGKDNGTDEGAGVEGG